MNDYAVVIVTYRSREHLARLLEELQAAQIVVVDTGPDDGAAALAAKRGAIVIVRRDNPGFGAANNLGLEAVSEEITVLLNPDTRDVQPLPALARRARDPGLHAPRLRNPDGTIQRSAHPLPGTLGAFLPAVLPWLPRPLRHRAEPYRAPTTRTVGWAIAACLAARTDTLRQLGPFDPSIHLYAEDMDLCLRARNAGMPTIYHPDLAITHVGGHSVQDEPFDLLARQRRDVIRARRGAAAQRADDAAQLLTFATRAAVKRPNDRERAQLNALLKAARPGFKPGPRR